MAKQHFFNIENPVGGMVRKLAEGVNARIFTGDNIMVSIVSINPGYEGKPHCHPEEQWGVVLKGGGIRIQEGMDHPVVVGDFWHTPGGVMHGFRAGAEGVTILDLFSPPRAAYQKPGEGYGD